MGVKSRQGGIANPFLKVVNTGCLDRSGGCEHWVTGVMHLNFERDAADGHVLELRVRGGFPRRWAVRSDFVAKLTAEIAGGAEWQKNRLVLRLGRQEHAYRRTGTCTGCGYILLEYAGAA